MQKAEINSPPSNCTFLLCGVNSSGGANVLASSAVDAYVGINDVLVSAFGNSFNGASACARAAAYAFV